MKIRTHDLSKILRGYSNVWLALNEKETKVVAKGKNLKAVIQKARDKGVDKPVVTRASGYQGAYIV